VADLPELKALFREKPAGGSTTSIARRLTPGALRRVKMFAAADEKTLESVLRYMETVEVPAFAVLVRQGEPADAMYFLLSGEVRAYVIMDGKESTLATILPGEAFGEIALLDHGPRSAFVAANQPSLLLKMTATGFEQIMREAPALAMPFALGLARALAARFRSISKRYQDSIHFSRAAGVG
jgi:CRP-like cAMP-binding protein